MKLLMETEVRLYGNKKTRFGIFLCDICGKEVEKPRFNGLRAKSCGCNKSAHVSERNTTHGACKRNRILFDRWTKMIQRCYNENNSQYPFYGGKGVTVCEQWRDNPNAYIEWALDNGWDKTKVIDKDVKQRNIPTSEREYSPNTCLIITARENSKYRSYRDNITGFYGINYKKHTKRYEVYLFVGSKRKYIGSSKILEEAVTLRDNYIRQNNLNILTKGDEIKQRLLEFN